MTFFKILMTEFPQPPSKANQKKTRVNIINFTYCECVLIPSGVRSAVAVTTIVQLDRFFFKTKILICCLKQGSSTPNNLMVSLKAIWVPFVFRARPSLSPQGLEYLFFHRKVLQPRVNTWQQHRSCQSDSLIRGKHYCNTLEIFSF